MFYLLTVHYIIFLGLNAVNISLDTLVSPKFEFITRRIGLNHVLRSIDSAVDMGFSPVKVFFINKINYELIYSMFHYYFIIFHLTSLANLFCLLKRKKINIYGSISIFYKIHKYNLLN